MSTLAFPSLATDAVVRPGPPILPWPAVPRGPRPGPRMRPGASCYDAAGTASAPPAAAAAADRMSDEAPNPPSPAPAAPWWHDALLNLLPGLLAGTQLAGLLFFLNPRLPFSLGPYARGILLCGLVLGIFSSAALTPWTVGRPGRARRWLPWLLTTVLAAAAVLDWVHAARFSYFVPPGVNARLIKAALWLTLGGLLCFYTALLHSLQMRPYGRRTKLGLAAVAVLSVVVLAERREAYEPPALPPPRPSVAETEIRPWLVVVGLEAATVDAVLPLARQGQLPFFARLIEEGAYGRLETLPPKQPNALWTTVATGRLPYGHGILDDHVYPAGLLAPGAVLRLLPAGIDLDLPGRRIAGARSRLALPAWEILARLGVPAGFVGWPATYGTSAPLPFAFSDRFFQGIVDADSAKPPELAERGLLFRVGADQIDPAIVARFGDEVPHDLLRALGQDLWRESLAVFLLDQRRSTRALFLDLPGLADVSQRYFGGFSSVQFEGVQSPEPNRADHFLTTYYRHLDDVLSRLWQRIPEPRMLAVVSAHGVSAPGPWRQVWADLRWRSLEGTFGGAPDGVFFLIGEGVRPGVFLEGARLVDVLPTVLYGMRAPIASDLDGSVLTAAFESAFLTRHPLNFIPSYETLAAE